MVADGYEHMRAAAPDGYGHMAASGPDEYGHTPPPAAPGYGHMQPSARDWYGPTQPPAAPGYGPPAASGYGHTQPPAAPGYGHTQPPAPDWYGHMQPPAAGYGHMRAATADRERAIDVLKAAYAEGRLTADEYQERVGQVYASRTYAELGLLTADLPIGPLGTMVPPRPAQLIVPVRRPVNSLAVVSLICALIPGLPSAAAVVTGVVARSQIRETGERGAGMAAAGIAIGAFVLVLFLLFLAAA